MASISISPPASTLHSHTPRRLPPASQPLAVSFASCRPRPTSISLPRAASRSFHAAQAVAGEAQAAVQKPKVLTSDSLLMFFKAEGTMEERLIPKVTKALQELEGISDLEVHVEEGIASVVLTKETTVQATGVASNLVEVIQGAGFKLRTLSLGFEDEQEGATATS